MKKFLAILCSVVLAAGMMAGCGKEEAPATGNNTTAQGQESSKQEEKKEESSGFKPDTEITVISREASSGTRGAFDEMMKIIVKEDGTEKNMLFEEAVIVDSTDAVSSKVEVDPYAIGYTSLGSVTDAVKAVSVDGVEATVENINNGSYSVARPFVLATKGEGSELAQDFMAYVMSNQGQKIVGEKGFIAVEGSGKDYTASGLSGKITMSGSTSVEKVIEKLKEEYQALNPDVEIEITFSGSGAGIKDALADKVEIAMASRALTADESAQLTPHIFAQDGIAVVVNKTNTSDNLTTEQINSIFTGKIRTWADVAK